MLASVVIPTRDRPLYVVDAVRSVLAGSHQNLELFVIDQSTNDATRDLLSQFESDPRFHYVTNRAESGGPASSRNVGIALSSGEIVANIDDDVTVDEDWLRIMVAEFEADPDLQFVCGRLAPPDEHYEEGVVPTFDPDEFRGQEPNWRMLMWTAGANYTMRRAVFDRLGGYNELFGPGTKIGAADDGELGLRIMRAGLKWKMSGEATVVHTHGHRNAADGDRLLKGYWRGIGASYGRAMRCGDPFPGIWFLFQLLRELIVVVIPHILLRRRPTRLGGVLARLEGYWEGLRLRPSDGLVTHRDLADLRTTYATVDGALSSTTL